MKLAFNQIEPFLQRGDPSVRAALIYGPDEGLVSERAVNLAKKIAPSLDDPFTASIMAGSDMGDDAGRLIGEMASLCFGGGRRFVWVKHAVEANGAALAKLLEEMPEGDSFLLLDAGDLDKRSKLRAVAESGEKRIVAIPCYVEDDAARRRTVESILGAEGFSVSRDVVSALVGRLPSDRLAMRSELEKLALYAHGAKAIALEDVEAAIGEAGSAEMDDLMSALANGDAARVDEILNALWAEQVSPVAVLRAAQRHFLRLQSARGMVDLGLSVGEAVKKLQPPVFWKAVSDITRQVQKWPLPALAKVLLLLTEAEATVKTSGIPDTTYCAQAFLSICRWRAAV